MAGIAHFVNVAGAQALLAVNQAISRRMAFAHQVGHQRMHACGGEQYRGVVFGNERSALDQGVAVLNEEVNISLLQFLRG